ncbi:hypothetical protein BDV18DRAFT_94823 [Aspergillus unguis]
MALKPDDIIPLYLEDRLSLDDAVQYASSHPPKDLLKVILKESRSLPRETDTEPTTATPDLPSPAQEILLEFVRALQASHDQASGTGIQLDYDGDHGDDYRCGYEEVRDAMAGGIMDTYRSASGSGPGPGSKSGPAGIIEQRAGWNNEKENEDVFASGLDTDTAQASSSASIAESKKRRRRSSGPEKHLFNLVSFLAFLTKEKLFLLDGVGERIAAEMISETLDEHQTPLQGNKKNASRPQRPSPAPGHEPWFGLGSSSSSSGAGPGTSVSAVSLWLIIMGEELYCRARDRQKKRGGVGENADIAWAQLATTVVREWVTWTGRLQFLALRETLGIEARELASEAAAVMRRV